MSYVGAPYNFVPFGTKVYRKDSITRHDEFKGLSGYLEYQVTAQTPIMIDSGNGHFYKNKDGKAAIPGSTMRGLVRSNMQVLSQSSFYDDIQNERFMYRCVGEDHESLNKEEYDRILGQHVIQQNENSFSVLKNVKAGYMSFEKGKYYITPAKSEAVRNNTGEMNYYILSEKYIAEKNFENFELLKDKSFYMQHECEYSQGNVCYTEMKNLRYRPYVIQTVYYKVKNHHIIGLSKWEKNGYRKGTVISSGYMKDKKVFYVIPEKVNDLRQRIVIDSADIDTYRRDYQGRKTKLSGMASRTKSVSNESWKEIRNKIWQFYDLPGKNEEKPVFYIELDGKKYFGFTPRLRLFYDKSIHDGIPEVYRRSKLDYCKSIFGYATDKESYKSRVSFQDAVIDKKMQEMDEVYLTMGEPKATSFMDYLIGKDGKASAYRRDFQLRGMKQYWLHQGLVKWDAPRNLKAATHMYPYPSRTSFTGSIRFNNFGKEELGMLLWSLLLEKNSNQNIGKGKPYGFGRVTISLKELKIQDSSQLYSSEKLCLDPYTDQTKQSQEYIQLTKEDMTRFLGKPVMEYRPIRDFLRMKNKEQMPDESRIRYMKLKEYQNRKGMLDTVDVVLDKKCNRANWK